MFLLISPVPYAPTKTNNNKKFNQLDQKANFNLRDSGSDKSPVGVG